jgi:hypothetical protein
LSCEAKGPPPFPLLCTHHISHLPASPTSDLSSLQRRGTKWDEMCLAARRSPDMAWWQNDTGLLREPVQVHPLQRFTVLADLLLGLLLDSEDGSDIHLLSVGGVLPNCMALQLWRPFSLYSPCENIRSKET